MDTRLFLRTLFDGSRPGDRIHLRILPAGPGSLSSTDPDDPRLPIVQDGQEVFHGVAFESHLDNAKTHGRFVWCDVDKTSWTGAWEGYGPAGLRPTFVVLTGKPAPVGHHIYWKLDRAVEIATAVNLSGLAQLAFLGDPKVVEGQRVLRTPGYYNHKKEYGEPRLAFISHADVNSVHSIEALEERLFGLILAHHWTPGNGHQLALDAGALLVRAGWSEERIERAVLASLDGEDASYQVQKDRVKAAVDAVARRATGTLLSSADLRASVGPADWKRLLGYLGITAKDGELSHDGQVIGRSDNVERDVGNWIVSRGGWAYVDGGLVRWSGTLWESVAQPVLVSTVFRLLEELRVIGTGGVEQEFVPTNRLASNIASILAGRLATQPLPRMAEYLFPLQNGILNVVTRELLPHAPENHNRWIAPFAYDPTALCPTWDRFLEFAAPETRDFLQEWMGYCLIRGNPKEWMVWLVGDSGTGKSTVLKTLTQMLGSAAVAIPADNIAEYTLAGLSEARVVICGEVSSKTLRTPLLKQIVSGDPMAARNPYGRPFTVTFQGKMVWASNVTPPLDQVEGFSRRLLILPFVRKPERADPNLLPRILSELPGVFNWALDGLARIRQLEATPEGWQPPVIVRELVLQYNTAADAFGQFVSDELILDEDGKMEESKVYGRYKRWSEDRNAKPSPLGPLWANELFKRGLRRIDDTNDGGRRVKFWSGASMAPEIG